MHSLTPADFSIIGFYLGFLVLIGFVFRRFNRDISDYFRGGGTMLWWMSGSSALMSAVSAWSFTGAAGSVYDTGTLVAAIYWSNAINMLLVSRFTAGRFRRMRVVTYAEALRRRFGSTTEQFYVWVQLPVSVVKSGIELSALGIFMSAVFHTDVLPTILIVGAVIVIVAMIGGAWAVVAGDFLQSLLMLLVLGCATWFTLGRPEIGGVAGLVHRVSPAHWAWGGALRREIIVLWCVATFVNSFFNFNNMAEGAARFLTVRDETEARKAARAMSACFVFIPVLLLTPALAATAIFPNLHEQFPALRNPQEAAFVSVCLRAMPAGVVGLLVAGIFAVAMASMDTGLNRNSGLVVRNVWQRFIRPAATERELLFAGKLSTLLLGVVIVSTALTVALYSQLDLFNLILTFGSLVSLPLMIPTVLGLVVRRAPPWAGWTTPIVGLAAGWTLRSTVGMAQLGRMMGWTGLSSLETTSLGYAVTVLLVVIVCCAWFGAATWVSRHAPEPDFTRSFFLDLQRPIDTDREHARVDTARQYRTVGTLSMIYGLGIAGFSLVPTAPDGRITLLGCGGVIAVIGVALRRAAARPGMEAGA
jgi:solute:Na+ symporter, SSS family